MLLSPRRLLALGLTAALLTCSSEAADDLDTRVAQLEEQVALLKDTVSQLQKTIAEADLVPKSAAGHDEKPKGSATAKARDGFPRHYKIRQKPYERVMFDLSVSFDVYSGGDTYLGEFRQVCTCFVAVA